MSTVTGYRAFTADGQPVQVDAHGNNAAFACLKCHAPCLAVLREHQRGASASKPVVCPGCASAFWLAVQDNIRSLVVHEAPDFELSDPSLPRVIGRPSKDAGIYKLGNAPGSLAEHNQASWNIIWAILRAYQTADYYDLVVAVRNHKHGDKSASGPQSFVSYCIRSGWLVRAA